jgi:hypothetical protein
MDLGEILVVVDRCKAAADPNTAGIRRAAGHRAADLLAVVAAIHLAGACSRVHPRGQNSHYRTPARSIAHSMEFTDVVVFKA